jgi:hypothetical protein
MIQTRRAQGLPARVEDTFVLHHTMITPAANAAPPGPALPSTVSDGTLTSWYSLCASHSLSFMTPNIIRKVDAPVNIIFSAQASSGGSIFNGATIVISLVALGVGALAAFYSRLALSPARRQLEIVVVQLSRIVTTSHDKMSVHYDNRPLQSPYLCSVRIQSIGKHSVSSTQFDQDQPIELSLGATIIEVLDISSTPTDIKPPDIRTDDQHVRIYPSLLAKSQVVDCTILTEGKPSLSIRHQLIDTDVHLVSEISEVGEIQERRTTVANRWSKVSLLATATAAIIGFVIWLATQLDHSSSTSDASDSSSGSSSTVDSHNYGNNFSLWARPSRYSVLYPANNTLPPVAPDDGNYPPNTAWTDPRPPGEGVDNYVLAHPADRCPKWEAWADSNGMAPLGGGVKILFDGSPNTDVTILNIQVVVINTFDLVGGNRIRCSTEVRTSPPANYILNLDRQGAAIVANNAYTLNNHLDSSGDSVDVTLEGTAGRGYNYMLEVQYQVREKVPAQPPALTGAPSKSDAVRTEVLGSWKQPLRVAFERADPGGLSYYDWNESSKQWTALNGPR